MRRSVIELSQYNWLFATIYFNLPQPALKFTEANRRCAQHAVANSNNIIIIVNR